MSARLRYVSVRQNRTATLNERDSVAAVAERLADVTADSPERKTVGAPCAESAPPSRVRKLTRTGR